MSDPDKNFFVISGDDTGNIWVNNVLTFTADQPGMRELHIGSVLPRWGERWSDALKISGVRRLRLYVDVLDGRLCDEDAIDINHTEDFEVFINILYPAKRYCGTIKGESKRCAVTVHLQIGHGGEVDWDYGNHENKRNGNTVEQSLSSKLEDRGTVLVRCLQAVGIGFAHNTGPYRYIWPSPGAWYHSIVIFFFRLYYQLFK